ncbi:MAG: metalloregulator ArsR/SmtB family transcription factor [Acidimicrobiia bacterium]|nr:metalloregulator ArsR/SmtB family transcription factor [Acidimicrobiia bacterium]
MTRSGPVRRPPGEPTEAEVAACCPPLAEAFDRGSAEELALVLKALADPARIQILGLLRASPDGETCVCHLVEPLGLAQPTVSHHLRVLHDAGLLDREQRGVWAYYRVRADRLAAVRAALA